MEHTARSQLLVTDGHVPAAAAGGGSNDILVEGKRDEEDQDQEIDNGTDGAHCLGTVWIG